MTNLFTAQPTPENEGMDKNCMYIVRVTTHFFGNKITVCPLHGFELRDVHGYERTYHSLNALVQDWTLLRPYYELDIQEGNI